MTLSEAAIYGQNIRRLCWHEKTLIPCTIGSTTYYSLSIEDIIATDWVVEEDTKVEVTYMMVRKDVLEWMNTKGDGVDNLIQFLKNKWGL